MNNMRYKLFILGTIMVSGISAYSQNTSNSSGNIRGIVTDYLTEAPLPNVQIKVYKRIIDILDNGAKSMRSMNEITDLNIETKTNNKGEYSVIIPLGIDPNYFLVKANYEGYEGMINMFLPVKKDIVTIANFEMVKSNLSPSENMLLEKKGTIEKAKIEIEKAKDAANKD